MAESIIEINDLTKDYEETRAVDHLSLTVNKGEIFGLLGPNGAGKSTTILMMLGLTEPTSGSVKVCGLDATREPLKVKERVGYLPDNVGFEGDLTGLENLIYTAQLNKVPYQVAKERAIVLLEQVGLTQAANKKAGKYSRGMKQRLGLADVLIKDPEVIILDEPTLGIDPKGIKELLDLIQHLSREKGITVLLSSHHLHQVQQICDRVGLFVKGNLIAEGEIDTLAKELFGNQPIVLTFEVDGKVKEVSEMLANQQDIQEITTDGQVFTIKSEKDITATIAKKLADHDIGLTRLERMRYGLDEIYQRYFEGGDSNEA